ncbi:hypothetical protein ABIB99_006882 [Bradyrhizobium sp. LA6.1]
MSCRGGVGHGRHSYGWDRVGHGRRSRLCRSSAGRRLSDPGSARLRRGAVHRRLRHPGHRLCRACSRAGMEAGTREPRTGVQRGASGSHDRRPDLRSDGRQDRSPPHHPRKRAGVRHRDAAHRVRGGHDLADRVARSDRSWSRRCNAQCDCADLRVQPASPPRHHGHDHVRRLFDRCGPGRAAGSRHDPRFRLALGVPRRRPRAAAASAFPLQGVARVDPVPGDDGRPRPRGGEPPAKDGPGGYPSPAMPNS